MQESADDVELVEPLGGNECARDGAGLVWDGVVISVRCERCEEALSSDAQIVLTGPAQLPYFPATSLARPCASLITSSASSSRSPGYFSASAWNSLAEGEWMHGLISS